MESQMSKLDLVKDQLCVVEEFLEWLSSHGELSLGEWLLVGEDGKPRVEPRLAPKSRSNQDVVYEYFGIDAEELEKERRDLLQAIRASALGPDARY